MKRRTLPKMDAPFFVGLFLASPFVIGGLAVIVILNAMIVRAAIAAVHWVW